MADSIEEVNRVRISLGMQPLPVPGGGPQFKGHQDSGSDNSSEEEEDLGSTLESRQAQGYDNWKKLQDEADAKTKREAKTQAIKKARDAATSHAKLVGKGLGDADDGADLDTKSWLQQQKKRQKKLEKEKRRKLEQEMAERENVPEYTAADLAGVKVAHEVEDFEGGEEQVLTLKDTTIDENEEDGDELENVDLRERESLKEKLDIKKKKPVYDPNAEVEGGDGTILKHYDETIDGKKRTRFTLDGQGASLEEREAKRQAVGEKLKRQPISLDIVKDTFISDYNEASEQKIKKPKKSKTKSKRQKVAEEDEIFPASERTAETQTNDDIMYMDAGGAQPSKPKQIESFVDDDDLQASLAIQRRAALKKRKRTKPEDIAHQLREETSATPGAGNGDEEQTEEGGLIIDETTEFVANLQRKEEERVFQASQTKEGPPAKKQDSPDEDDADVNMDQSYNEVEDEDVREAGLKREASTPTVPNMTETGLEEEATLNQGLGATLNMLAQRGLLKKTDGDINALHRDRERFLSEKQKREADIERKARTQRERDRASGKLDHMSAREREEYARYENKQRDQIESRAMTDIFNREYKPDVQLKYVDEFGRSMTQKEAFKDLSHQFHGKGSGKQKTEKHLKKIDDDKQRAAQSTLDASQATGLNNAMGATSKKNRQAGVRLA